jgi:uncharacterized protein (TIGR03066 family)
MNVLKLCAVGVVMCLVVAGVRADDSDLAKQLVGKWELTKAAEGTPPVGTIVEFTKDGTVKVSGKNEDKPFSMEGKYKLETNGFVCTFNENGKEKVIVHKDVKIDGKMMTFMTEDGKVVELKRQ